MSIIIDKDQCKKCGKCSGVCPGNLISRDDDGYAAIQSPKLCWGCTGCMKACPYNAIALTLEGNDNGAKLYAKNQTDVIQWEVYRFTEPLVSIKTSKSASNKY